MFFNLKLVASAIALAGVSVPLWLSCKKHCSLTKSSYFYKSSIDTSESILDCKDNGKNYSVFLVLKDGTKPVQKDNLSFEVVDNNNGKVKWGPKADSRDKWTSWGIEITVNDAQGGAEEPKIRIPGRGNKYETWSSIFIPCHKSQLKLKTNSSGTTCNGKGGILRSNNATFEVNSQNISIKSGKIEWKGNFQPRETFCSY